MNDLKEHFTSAVYDWAASHGHTLESVELEALIDSLALLPARQAMLEGWKGIAPEDAPAMAWLACEAIERVPNWNDSGDLVTAHAHCAVLNDDLPTLLNLTASPPPVEAGKDLEGSPGTGPASVDDALSKAWGAVNVLGAPDTACTTPEENAYCKAIGDALAEIEKLGGRPW